MIKNCCLPLSAGSIPCKKSSGILINVQLICWFIAAHTHIVCLKKRNFQNSFNHLAAHINIGFIIFYNGSIPRLFFYQMIVFRHFHHFISSDRLICLSQIFFFHSLCSLLPSLNAIPDIRHNFFAVHNIDTCFRDSLAVRFLL